MRKIREALRLRHERGRSQREIAASLKIAHSTVNEYLRRAAEAGLSWPLPRVRRGAARGDALSAAAAVEGALLGMARNDWSTSLEYAPLQPDVRGELLSLILDLGGLQVDLQDLLERRVDLKTTSSLRADVRERVADQANAW